MYWWWMKVYYVLDMHGLLVFCTKLNEIWSDLDEEQIMEFSALWLHGRSWTHGVDSGYLMVDREHCEILYLRVNWQNSLAQLTVWQL